MMYMWELAILPGDYVPGIQRYVYHKGRMTTPIVEFITWDDWPVTVANITGRWYYLPLNPHQVLFSEL